MGFDISDDFNNRKPLSVSDIQLQRAFLNDNQYLTHTAMGAVAEAIAAIDSRKLPPRHNEPPEQGA